MAFMSIFMLAIMFVAFLAGAGLVIVALVVLISRKVKKSRGKEVKLVSLILGIIALVIGVGMMFPMGGLVTAGLLSEKTKQERYDNLENTALADPDTWREEGFDFEGKHLVRVDALHNLNKLETTVVGNMIFEGSKNYNEIELIENESGYDIYDICGYCMVDENEVDAVFDYYMNEAKTETTITWYSCPGDSYEKAVIDFDKYKLYEIKLLYDLPDDERIQKNAEEVIEDFEITLQSEDGLFSLRVPINTYSDCVTLSSGINSEFHKGYVLDQEMADYVMGVFEAYKQQAM